LASSSGKYTRNNPEPNLTKLVDDLEKILRERKKKNNLSSPLLKRSTSLSEETIQTIEDLQFDLKFEHSLFRSKSDLDLRQVIVDLPTLLSFIPKVFMVFQKRINSYFGILCVRKSERN
jgi:hypothetical protein